MVAIRTKKRRMTKLDPWTIAYLAPLKDGPYYFATYVEHQAYGGPEEGGWWYDRAYLMDVQRVSAGRLRQLATEVAQEVAGYNAEHGDRGRYESATGQGSRMFFAVSKSEPKLAIPEERPRYE